MVRTTNGLSVFFQTITVFNFPNESIGLMQLHEL